MRIYTKTGILSQEESATLALASQRAGYSSRPVPYIVADRPQYGEHGTTFSLIVALAVQRLHVRRRIAGTGCCPWRQDFIYTVEVRLRELNV